MKSSPGSAALRFLQSGFTLIESMVAMVLGLILAVGISQAYMTLKQLHSYQGELARLVENGWVATEMIGRELRRVRYFGCLSEDAREENLVLHDHPSQPLDLWELQGVHGVDGASGGPDTIRLLAVDGEAFLMLSADVNLADSDTFPDLLPTGHGLQAGDAVAFSDCKKTLVFHLESVGGGLGCAYCPDLSFVANETKAHTLRHVEYYIASNSWGEPALFRRAYDGVSARTGEELLEGVEDMQFLYGRDTDDDGVANRYYTATQLDGIATDPVSPVPQVWRDVVSVKATLTLRSLDDSVALGGGDGYLRQDFAATYSVRNFRILP